MIEISIFLIEKFLTFESHNTRENGGFPKLSGFSRIPLRTPGIQNPPLLS
jgi:hypothetical protein